jgi:SH3-like domain-containing protein
VRLGLTLAAALLAASGVAGAIEFRSIGTATAVLHDGPSLKAVRQHIATRGTPVEVLSAIEGWVKVREPGGVLGWVEARTVRTARTVVVTSASSVVRRAAALDALPVFEAAQGVVLDLVEVQGGWLKVRHRDGLEGFVRAADVWGT